MMELYNTIIMTRKPAPDSRPVVLTIAGSDSGGGAGIQADPKTIEAGGAFGTSAITAVTAQTRWASCRRTSSPSRRSDAQIDAVPSDFDVRAVKTGMLATAPVIAVVTGTSTTSTPGGRRSRDGRRHRRPSARPDAENVYEDLLAHAALTTPNADEAEVLTGIELTDHEGTIQAGKALLETGVDAALVKGGHVPTDRVRDVLVTADDVKTYEHPRVDTDATHGSGCTLASAITTRLAHDEPLADAVDAGVSFIERAVRYHLDVGEGPGSVHHMVALRERAARQRTQEDVEGIVRQFVEGDVSRLVPEVGMNVVGATPYAEEPGETAAVEGRITRTLSGINPNRGVRFGASSHVARFLLSAREFDPSVRFAVNRRFDDEIEDALGILDGPAVELDRTTEPEPDVEGSTMGWVAHRAFETC